MSHKYPHKYASFLSIPVRLSIALLLAVTALALILVLTAHADGPIVTKTVDDDTPSSGQLVTYTVIINNNDSYSYTNALISDTLPISLTFSGPVTLDPPQGSATLAQDAGDLPTLASGLTITNGTSVTVTFPVTVNTGLAAGTVVTNTAAVTCTEIVTPAMGQVDMTISPMRLTAVYTSFDSTNIQLFQLNGDAALSGNRLWLAGIPSVDGFGTAWWQRRVSLEDNRSFSAYFVFQISNPGSGGADGLIFALQAQSSGAGGAGLGMGYDGISPSIGIEFDIYANPEVSDPNDNHVGVDTNGNVQSLQTANPPGGASLESGTWHVWVDYNGPSDALEVRMNQNNSARPASATLTRMMDLESIFGPDVYVGFTAAIGGAYADHEILSFYFHNDYIPGGITPDTQTYEQTASQVDLSASPDSIPADGVSTSVVTATVRDVDDNPVGSERVDFTTDLGTVSPESAVTNAGGVATTTLMAGTTPATATVRGSVFGGAYDEAQVTLTSADLSIVKSVLPTTIPGGAITYTLVFSNAGDGTATGVVITDSVPVSVTGASVSSSGASITPRGGTRYVWNVANLAQGEGGIVTITGVLSEPLVAGTFTNTAIITTTTADVDTTNNSSEVGVTVQNVAPVAGDNDYSTPMDTPASGNVLTDDTGDGADSDANGDPLTAVRDTDPATGTLDLHGDGDFVYTPTLGYSGAVTFTYIASDGALTDTATVTITVSANVPTANDDGYTTAEDTPLLVSAPGVLGNDTDPNSDPLTATLASGATHGTLTLNGDGSFVYTPTMDYNGSDSFGYRATDGTYSSNLATVVITVTAEEDAPSFGSTPVMTATEDVTYTYAISTTDPDVGDVLTITAPVAPAWLSLTDHGDGTAELSGVPGSSDVGTYAVSLLVTDGGGLTDTQNFSITVLPEANNPPAFTSTPVIEATEGITYTYAISTTDPDAGDVLTITAPVAPAWLSLTDHGDGTAELSGTPGISDLGAHAVALLVTDSGGLTGTQSFAVEVVPGTNYPPVANDDVFTVIKDSQNNLLAVLGNDQDPNKNQIFITAVGSTSHGAVSIKGSSSCGVELGESLIYTPDVGYEGREIFTYVASDGTLTDTATITVTVDGIEADIGFRPSQDGYQFENYDTVYGLWPRPAVLIDMFGENVVCRPNTISPDGAYCSLNATARKLVRDTEQQTYGQAYGIAVTSLRFFKGVESPSDIVGGVDTVPALTRVVSVTDHIMRYSLQFMTEPTDTVQYPHGWIRGESASRALNRISRELSKL